MLDFDFDFLSTIDSQSPYTSTSVSFSTFSTLRFDIYIIIGMELQNVESQPLNDISLIQ